MARPRRKTPIEATNDWHRKALDRINYTVRKDAVYNKGVLKAAANRLTGGSVTALLNAALACYLEQALGNELPEILRECNGEKENQK